MSVDVDKIFLKTSNKFATELYQKTIEGRNGNVLISPIVVQSATTLAMFGASGDTKAEIIKGLQYPENFSDDAFAEHFKSFHDTVNKNNGLCVANKVYVMKNYSIKKNFQDIAQKSFKSEAQSVDFSDSYNTTKTINSWFKENTNEAMKDIVEEDNFNCNTRMVLISILFFERVWAQKFDQAETFNGRFYINAKDTVKVDFMKVNNYFTHRRFPELDATAIELPYKNSDISMLIILPNSRTGLAKLESKFHTFDIQALSKKRMFKKDVVDIILPKFKIELDIDISGPLKKMGMEKMFSDAAEFNNLIEDSNNKPLKISKFVSKAFLDINEEGGEVDPMIRTGIAEIVHQVNHLNEIKFHVDHPFLFAIHDSSETYFLGRVKQF